MLSIDWKVENTEYDPATGAVNVVHWRCIATNGTVADSVYGSVALDPDPDAPGFVPLDELTEAMVLEWAQRRLDVDTIEAGLASSLATLLDPPTVTGLPWAASTQEANA